MKKFYYIALILTLIVIGSTAYKKYREYEATHNPVVVFSKIYKESLWGNGSGAGSDPDDAKPYMDLLQTYLDDPKYKTIVDLGCGDWQMMSHLTIPADKNYIGYDVVENVINYNNAHYLKPNISFVQIKSLEEIENVKGDLLIVKDVIQHWPNERVFYFFSKILPNYKYALITNGYDIAGNNNQDIQLGGFRKIDLIAEPFKLENIKLVLEYSAHEVKRSYLYINPNFSSDR